MIKVVLTRDLPDGGRRGEVKTVKEGYFRNFLAPSGFAVLATPAVLMRLSQDKAKISAITEAELMQAQELKAAIETIHKVVVRVKVSDQGHLFGALDLEQVRTQLRDQNVIIPESVKLISRAPIKTVGVHVVELKLAPQVTASLTVEVIGDSLHSICKCNPVDKKC